jgi:hypothetical protein
MPLPVTTAISPPKEAWCQLIAYSGSNPEYVGWARSTQPVPTVALVGALGFVSITNSSTTATVAWTAHGLATGNRVVVSGASVDTDLNGSYVIIVTGADAFTFTTASVGNAAYTEATLAITTTAPRTGDPVWAIQKNVYSTNLPVQVFFAEGRSDPNLTWGSRTTYAYQ